MCPGQQLSPHIIFEDRGFESLRGTVDLKQLQHLVYKDQSHLAHRGNESVFTFIDNIKIISLDH